MAIASFLKMRAWAKERSIQRGLSVPISLSTCYETHHSWFISVWAFSCLGDFICSCEGKHSEPQLKCPEISAEGILSEKFWLKHSLPAQRNCSRSRNSICISRITLACFYWGTILHLLAFPYQVLQWAAFLHHKAVTVSDSETFSM